MSREYDMERLRVLCDGVLATVAMVQSYDLDLNTKARLNTLRYFVARFEREVWGVRTDDMCSQDESDDASKQEDGKSRSPNRE